jgi:hypothetical protein
MFSYRLFIKQAWQITKRYKHLWFFGLFASLLYASGEYQVVSSFLRQEDGSLAGSTWLIVVSSLFNPAFWSGFLQMASTNPIFLWTFVFFVVITLALFIMILYISVVSQISIVDQSAKILKSKKKLTNLSISDGLEKSPKWFWPVLWLNLSTKVIVTICFFILSIPLFFIISSDGLFVSIVYSLLFLIFLPITLYISFVIKYAIASCIIENKKFLESIKRGMQIFQDNWLVSFELAFILFVINFIAGLITLLFISLFFVSLYIFGLFISSVGLMVVGLLLAIASMALVASLLGVFQTSAWTGLFLTLKENKGKSKLERVFAKK